MTETTLRTGYRVRGSALTGRNWLNTGGRHLQLEDLRGKIVILDFWTFCCINCLHVIDELRPLEQAHADVLVTIGVHSPKFEHEADPAALAAAVERYDIRHPVLDDPQLGTWAAYTARAWPTLVVIDPEGYIVAHLSGEGHAAGLASLVAELVAEHEAKGTLHRGDGPYVPAPSTAGALSFPGKLLGLPGTGTFLVGDTGHHRLVELEADLTTVRRTIGSGTRGFTDGGPADAEFDEPQGLALLPAALAAEVGYDVVVADSVNHRLRGVDLATGTVTTLAGNGTQRLLDAGSHTGAGRQADARESGPETGTPRLTRTHLGTDALRISLSSPWDVVYSTVLERVIIAMAGTHQLFSYDPRSHALDILAGTGLEGLLDGEATTAWFAQPSGLAEGADGTLWIADSETSAIRSLTFETIDGRLRTRVGTMIGTGLFDFGFRDGPADQARLQHPLGVAALPDGSIAVADTYNGAVRRYDPVTQEVSTLLRGLAEPSDVAVDPGPVADGGDPLLVVVETNNHQLVRAPLPRQALAVDEGALSTQRPTTAVTGGPLAVTVRFTAPTGQKLDDRWGDPTQLTISSSPESLIRSGGGTSQGLTREVVLAQEAGDGVLHITARAASCDGEPGGQIPDHAACHLYQQDWGIPVTVSPDGESALTLELRGLD